MRLDRQGVGLGLASSSASSMSSAAHRGFLDGFRVGMSNDAGESFVTQLFVGKSPLVVPLIRQDLHILCDELSNKDTEGPDGSTFEGKAASSQCECLLEPVQKLWSQAVSACVWLRISYPSGSFRPTLGTAKKHAARHQTSNFMRSRISSWPSQWWQHCSKAMTFHISHATMCSSGRSGNPSGEKL